MVVWDLDEPRAVLERIAKALYVKHEHTVQEALPKRWIELILYLNEVERREASSAGSAEGRDPNPPGR